VNLRCRSERLKRAARGSLKIQDAKKSPKIAIWAPSHNFVGLYLRNYGTYRQSEKNLLSSNISSTCPHDMVNFGRLVAEIVSLVCGVEQRAPPTFGRAAIMLGTGPHSSLRISGHGASSHCKWRRLGKVQFSGPQKPSDLDLGSGHTAYHRASVINLYLYTKFH